MNRPSSRQELSNEEQERRGWFERRPFVRQILSRMSRRLGGGGIMRNWPCLDNQKGVQLIAIGEMLRATTVEELEQAVTFKQVRDRSGRLTVDG